VGSCFFDNMSRGLHLNYVFYFIFIHKFTENLPGGSFVIPPFTPLCTSLTKVDMDGKHVGNQNEWGFCEEGCEETNLKGGEDSLKGCDETNVKGCTSLRPPKNCVFPFSFRGSTFSSCTNEGGDVSGELWCSTKTDEFGNHVKGNWEICPEGCDLETELKTATATTTTPDTVISTQSTTTVIVATPFDGTSSTNNLLGRYC
jgi:hypothetical protein